MSRLHLHSAYKVHNENIMSVCIFSDNFTLASAAHEWDRDEDDVTGIIKIWSPGAGIVASHRSIEYSGDMARSPDGRLLAWGGSNGQVRLFNGNATDEKGTIQLHDAGGWVKPIFSPDSRLLITSAGRGGDQSQGNIILWDTVAGCKIASLATGWAYSLAVSQDCNTIAVGLVDGRIQLWDILRGHKLADFRGHNTQVRSLSFHPSGKILATAGLNELSKIWCLPSMQLQETLSVRGDASTQVNALVFLPTTGELVTGDERGYISLWDVLTGRMSNQYSTNAAFLDFELAENEDEIILRSKAAPEVTTLDVSLDGTRLAVGNVSGGIQLFDIVEGE